jgi:(1->4)-alpha-D-glucan 1-alpha-D-glucosylmutase
MDRPSPNGRAARPPSATYRLQLHPGFTLDDAAGVLPHLSRLGVSHVYLSPVLASVPGSTHGYDVVDHERVAPHLGGEEAWDRFTRAAGEQGLGIVVDIVPNHVSIEGGHNQRWLDVLESGPSSESADWFDIDWVGREEHQRGVVVLPVLGDLYGELLEAGELRLGREGVQFFVDCPGHRFPLAPRSLPHVLRPVIDALRDTHDEDAQTLEFAADSLEALAPARTGRERHRRTGHLRVVFGLLGDVMDRPHVASAIDEELQRLNCDPAAVHRVLEDQHYRLAYWRAGAKELDYRRFFDISTLAAIRVEHDEVFEAVHRLPLEWVSDGRIDGLRVDHPDGLADPQGYFCRLRHEAPDAWIVAEKILEGDEQLPEDWPVDGTTGYEAMRLVTGLLVDPAGLDLLAGVEAAAHALCGTEPPEPETVIEQAKHEAVEILLAADLERVTDLALRMAERRPRHRDHPRDDVRRAIAGMAVGLDVYRSYVIPGDAGGVGHVSDIDRERIRAASRWAIAHDETIDARLVEFLADVLTLDAIDPAEGPEPDERQFVVRFQQLTGPATAKGLEDTAWYRLARFVAANEVGADPLEPSVDVERFHDACRFRQEHWPHSMTTLSTHDTKRSADVRARLALLSEPGADWASLAERWLPKLLERWPEGLEPHAATLLIALQTMVGAWPIDGERLGEYLRKAAREAKDRTSWTRQDAGFEGALDALASIADDPETAAAFDADVARLVGPGRRNSLVQTAIALLQPGVPDVYQGTEGEDLSLVDPDNRRPVDYARLGAVLDGDAPAADPGDPDTKVRLTAALLDARRRDRDAFGAGVAGSYQPIAASGAQADRIVAFARGGRFALVAARFPTRGPVADSTVDLPAGPWRVLFGDHGGATFDGGRTDVSELLGSMPVVVLEAQP